MVIGAVTAPNHLVDHEDVGWQVAMQKEVGSLASFGACEEVSRDQVPPGVKIHGARWVHSLKEYGKAGYNPMRQGSRGICNEEVESRRTGMERAALGDVRKHSYVAERTHYSGHGSAARVGY